MEITWKQTFLFVLLVLFFTMGVKTFYNILLSEIPSETYYELVLGWLAFIGTCFIFRVILELKD